MSSWDASSPLGSEATQRTPPAGNAPRMPSSNWRWVALVILVVPALLGLVAMVLPMARQEALGPVRGIRLGLSPAQARGQLVTEGPGSFSSLAMGEDFALVWSPHVPHGLRAARMEFHLGQLVALRLTLAPSAPEAEGPSLAVSESSIRTREPSPDGVVLTWLARGCPTHADEVRRRMAERR